MREVDSWFAGNNLLGEALTGPWFLWLFLLVAWQPRLGRAVVGHIVGDCCINPTSRAVG